MKDVETISYKASTGGLTFEQPVRIGAAPAPIQQIEMTVQDTEVSIVFHFEQAVDLAEARSSTEELAECLLDTLALQYKVSVLQERCASYTSSTADGTQVRRLCNQANASDRTRHRLTIPQPAVAPFEQACRQPHDVNRSIFRLALNQSDPVTRFMLLYWILLQLNGDKQQRVDEQIKRFEPAVQCSPDPQNRKRQETVYKRLRNELAHSRAGVAPQDTWREIQTQVGGLEEIVKKALF